MFLPNSAQKPIGGREHRRQSARRNRSGFTLIEVMLAVTITALLLAAIATAMHASLMSYTVNEKAAAVTQTSRSVINRLVRDVRTADAILSTANSLTIIPPIDGSGITEIQYDFSGGELLYRVTKNGTPSTYVLIEAPDQGDGPGVGSFDVLREVGVREVWDGNEWVDSEYTKSVTVRLVLQMDGQPFGVTATSAPRRNQTY